MPYIIPSSELVSHVMVAMVNVVTGFCVLCDVRPLDEKTVFITEADCLDYTVLFEVEETIDQGT